MSEGQYYSDSDKCMLLTFHKTVYIIFMFYTVLILLFLIKWIYAPALCSIFYEYSLILPVSPALTLYNPYITAQT